MSPKAVRVNLVFVGEFFPSISILDSLLEKGAIDKSDFENVTYNALLNGQIVDLNLPWCTFSIIRTRLSIETSNVPYVRTADLASKYLREIAPTSKLAKLGINVILSYGYEDSVVRDKIGRNLVPPENWGSWGKEIEQSQLHPVGDPRHGGLINVGMRQGKPDSRSAGWIDVQITPGISSTESHDVVITINDHYEMSLDPRDTSSRGLMNASITTILLDQLEESFDLSIDRSLSIANGIIEAASNA